MFKGIKRNSSTMTQGRGGERLMKRAQMSPLLKWAATPSLFTAGLSSSQALRDHTEDELHPQPHVSCPLCRPRFPCPRAPSSLESTSVHTVSPRSRPIAREAGAAAELGDGSGREDIRHDAQSVQYWVVCGIWQHVNTYQVPYTHWTHEVLIPSPLTDEQTRKGNEQLPQKHMAGKGQRRDKAQSWLTPEPILISIAQCVFKTLAVFHFF